MPAAICMRVRAEGTSPRRLGHDAHCGVRRMDGVRSVVEWWIAGASGLFEPLCKHEMLQRPRLPSTGRLQTAASSVSGAD